MSCCLESSPSLEPAAGHSKAAKTLSPRPLTCPQPFLRPPPKALLGLQPVCLSARALFYIFIFLGRQNRHQTAPTGSSWVAFFFLSLHVKEKRQNSWGICLPGISELLSF